MFGRHYGFETILQDCFQLFLKYSGSNRVSKTIKEARIQLLHSTLPSFYLPLCCIRLGATKVL